MSDKIKALLARYADPRTLKWILILLGLLGLILGAGAPDDFGGGGSG